MDIATVTGVVGGGLGAIAAGLGLGVAIGRPIRRLARQNDEFRQDWYGMPARPGHAAESGVMERLSGIERELKTNGGSTLRDAVNRLEKRLDVHEGQLTEIRRGQDAP